MTHAIRSLASLLRDNLQTLEYRRHNGAAPEEPDYLLLAQHPDRAGAAHPQRPAHAPAPGRHSHATGSNPTRQEALNYLGELAKDYHLPQKLVYAVADAESSVNPKIDPQPNYEMKYGKRVLDEHGNPKIKNWDYGLMQINGPRIGHDKVKDAHGHRFLVGEEVKNDWKANARAGVAIIKHGYDLVSLSEGSGATPDDLALGTYSYCNHDHRSHKFLGKGPDGLPEDGANLNFMLKYRRTPEKP